VGDKKIHRKELDRGESPDGDELSEDEEFLGNDDFPQHSGRTGMGNIPTDLMTVY
jgi:hypothetical protein